MDKLKRIFQRGSKQDANAVRIRRRRAIIGKLTSRLHILRLALFVVGYAWLVVIPYPPLGRNTYRDENALLPGQANTNWDWGDVHRCDSYLGHLEHLRDINATSEQRAGFLSSEFRKLGIAASTQNYTFKSSFETLSGTNAYAVLSSPRTPGTEAIVISASWKSLDGALNLRGISTVLALAAFVKKYSLWAKDIVFVIGDGHLDGMHAWLSAYHGTSQSNLQAEHLELSSGVIWTALNIDYSGHSFSHLGIFFEGLNGRLPNQDLLNSFHQIARYANHVPVVLYDHLDAREHQARRAELDVIPSWMPLVIRDNADLRAYAYQARNVVRHIGYQARGRASGVHGLLHQFRIDAITIYAVPATGPHGFHAIGRVIESTLRTANNLLERLHASFFFYILTGPRFLQIGNYLPSVVLISIAMMFGGLKEWVDAGWTQAWSEKSSVGQQSSPQWVKRQRPVLKVLAIMITTHVAGAISFAILNSKWTAQRSTDGLVLVISLACVSATALLFKKSDPATTAPLGILLKSINLCFASTVISITTVLNFSLAAVMAVLLGVPLSISGPSTKIPSRWLRFGLYVVLGVGWMIFGLGEVREAIWNWQILYVWFAPFMCIVYAPLVLQAAIVCIL